MTGFINKMLQWGLPLGLVENSIALDNTPELLRTLDP